MANCSRCGEPLEDWSCGAVLGGSNRLQRGLNWLGHLRHLYAGAHFQPRHGFFAGGHDDQAMARSEPYQRWMFGDDKAGEKAADRVPEVVWA